MIFFNTNHGYLEGLVRGFKNGLLNQAEYQALTQCDTLEDLKLHLSVSKLTWNIVIISNKRFWNSDSTKNFQGTSYGSFLNDEAGVITANLISERLQDKFVAEFEHMSAHSSGQLTKFLDFIRFR